MARQWIRYCRLTASGGSGGDIDLSDLRCRFKITDPNTQSPRSAIIRITNLSEATAQGLPKNSGRVSLEAGYQDGYGLIFSGDVQAKHIGRESPTDTYADLYASDGARAYQSATVSKALRAGSSGRDIYDTVLEAMKPFGITAGHIPQILSQTKDSRAQVHFGMARDTLRKLALSLGCTWKIADGRLNVVPIGEALPGGPIVLNSTTGLIGRPVQTDQGIVGRALLNPQIAKDCTVQIDERSIDRAAFDLSYGGAPNNVEPNLGTIATDGIYKVLAVDHVGDTRGNPWYTEFVCNALGHMTTGQAMQGRA